MQNATQGKYYRPLFIRIMDSKRYLDGYFYKGNDYNIENCGKYEKHRLF